MDQPTLVSFLFLATVLLAGKTHGTMHPVNLMTMVYPGGGPGPHCEASSVLVNLLDPNTYICDNAYNGETGSSTDRDWASNGESDDAHITIYFPQQVLITALTLWQRCAIIDQYQGFDLTFSDGTTQIVDLGPGGCNGGGTEDDCSGVAEVFRELQPVLTDWVKLLGNADCVENQGNNGIREVEFWGWLADLQSVNIDICTPACGIGQRLITHNFADGTDISHYEECCIKPCTPTGSGRPPTKLCKDLPPLDGEDNQSATQ